MGSLAARLYEAHRRALEDPTSVPAWGNASTEERGAWARVEELATEWAKEPLPIAKVPENLDAVAFAERLNEMGRHARIRVEVEAFYENSAVVDQVREGQETLNELGAIAVGRNVLTAAEAVRDHRCPEPWKSGCSAGEHDVCGLSEKRAALDAAVDEMRAAREELGLVRR